MSERPMLDKMLEVSEKSQVIGEFLEWLQMSEADGGGGIVLAQWDRRIECGYSRERSIGRPGYRCVDGSLFWDDGDPVEDEDNPECPETCPRCEGRGWNERQEPILVGAHWSIERMLAAYFEIDLDAVERERQGILDEIRRKL